MQYLRIKFILPLHYSLLIENNQQLTLNLDQGQLMFSISTSEEANYRIYVFKSDDFDFKLSEEIVQKITNSFYLLCLEFDIGILINPNLKSTWISKSLLEEIRSSKGINAEDDFFGAKVLPSGTLIASSNLPTISISSTLARFEELLNKYFNLNYHRSERLLRAIEIHNSSNYLSIVNKAGRFILQMTALECLIDQKDVSKKLRFILNLTQIVIKFLRIDDAEKTSVLGSITFLKKTSIKRSGSILVQSLLDNSIKYNQLDPVTFFNKAYDLRSRLVHDGITQTKYLNINTIQMQSFIKDILTEYFNKICC